jgi:hypothetical protein
MNLYIVESPLQLLCAYEAIQQFNKDRYLLLIRFTGRGQNDLHLLNCAKFLNLDFESFTLRPDHFKLDFIKNILLWISLATKSFNHVFFGSIYSNALKLIRKLLKYNELFYLDDGAATLRAQTEIRLKKIGKVNWFTFFKLDLVANQIAQEHSFKKVREYKKFDSNKYRYFIGQPIDVIIGFSAEDYMLCVQSVAKKCTDLEPLLYIAHRVENDDFLQKIAATPCVQVLRLDKPIEMHFIVDTKYAPLEIYSCYSTALVTLKTFFPEALVYSIQGNQASNEYLESVYKYFGQIGVKQFNIQISKDFEY